MCSGYRFAYLLIFLTHASAERDGRSSSSTHSQSFKDFVSKHARTYVEGTDEYQMRQALYTRRLFEVEEHNRKAGRLWNKGINHLSDWTTSELSRLNGYKKMKSGKSTGVVGPHGFQAKGRFLAQIEEVVLPENVSWTHLNALQADKDQGDCGSCWATATSLVLGANAEINGYTRTFSDQEIVDCTPNPHHCGGAGGCDGATAELAMHMIMENGLTTAEETPYLGVESQCRQKPVYLLDVSDDGDGKFDLEAMTAEGFHGCMGASCSGQQIGLMGWTRLAENRYQPILAALTKGPLVISAAASDWFGYSKGIFDGCPKDSVVDHAIALVGYGHENGNKYWSIKNSWGKSWGEDGHIRLLRKEGDDEYCGTDSDPAIGTGCDGGPSKVRICGMCGMQYDVVAVHFNKRQ